MCALNHVRFRAAMYLAWCMADFACLPVGRECGIEDKITIVGFVRSEVYFAVRNPQSELRKALP